MIQYYFSQPSVVSAWKTPTAKLFEGQSGWIYNKTFVDLSKNYTSSLSQFMRDYFSVRHWFVVSSNDYIGYNKGVRSWLENELSFVENDAFKKAKLDDVVIDGTIVGYAKAVKQVAFSQIINSGHHLFHDAPKTMSVLFKSWLDSLS